MLFASQINFRVKHLVSMCLLSLSLTTSEVFSKTASIAKKEPIKNTKNHTKNPSNKITESTSSKESQKKVAYMESLDVSSDFETLTQFDKTKVVTTLGEALVEAYNNNPTLQQKQRETLSFNVNKAKASANFFPSIDLSAGISGTHSKQFQDSLMTNGQSSAGTQVSLSFSQNLFAGGATIAAINGADKAIRGKWAELLSAEQKVFTDVIKAYLDLGTKIATVNVRKAYRAAQQKNYDTSFEKHKIGEETITQVAIAEANLMKADAELRSAEAEVVAAHSTFSSATGVNAGNLLPPKEPLGLPNTIEKALDLALKNHPSIISATYVHQSAKHEVEQATASQFSPTVSLDGSITKSDNNVRLLPPVNSKYDQRQNNSQIGVTVKYNIFGGGSYNAQRRAAHDTALSKRFAIQAAENDVSGNVVSTFEAIKAARANIENYKKQVKAAEISVNATRQEMEVGTKVLKDVLDQEYNLVNAQISLLNAENAYYTACYKMVELLGGLHAKAMKLNVTYFDPEKFYTITGLGF